ncbi:hypothetical protein MLD38_011754 [Melastoma candidum]|uniref:Uncharacterized protein n=1 Tax=Melastoma candidum TaxID=119954 RepID=A0ACB9R424_9MYRT|nr:hypothetical protein MLD38_011754 [Melastoma candidum]
MAENLLRPQPYLAENPLERTLRESFDTNRRILDPPFPLSIPTPEEYLCLTRAILYSILTEGRTRGIRLKYLHAIVVDGYASFTALTASVVDELFERLLDDAKEQIVWIAGEMVEVGAQGFGDLLVSLLRQVVGGDYGDGNMWLCFEEASLFLRKWSALLEEDGEGRSALCCGFYCFLRLLGDHCRTRWSGDERLSALRQLEIDFCTKMLKEQFSLCMNVGRDLIRMLQDLVHVPEFHEIWKDLVLNPGAFGCPLFSDISQIYRIRTPSRYFLLRLTPEMERQMRFLLTNLKLGGQKRHQAWFWNKFLGTNPERETLVIDLIRFVCCAHHPTKEVLHSDIIPRWAVIGWLLKCCRKNYVEANAKLALFYDWLFFDERVDKVMNIEPALLLMVCSLPQYVAITDSLLEFLLLLVDNYDVDRMALITRGVLTSFDVLTRSGVVPSSDALTSAEGISPPLKERLGALLLRKEDHSAEAHAID